MNAKKVILFLCFLFFYSAKIKTMRTVQLNKKNHPVYGKRKLSPTQRRGPAIFDLFYTNKNGKTFFGKEAFQEKIKDIKRTILLSKKI